jgi:hypothetical protein
MQTTLSLHLHDEVLLAVTAEQIFVPRKSDVLIVGGRRMVVLEVQVEYIDDRTFVRVYLSSF